MPFVLRIVVVLEDHHGLVSVPPGTEHIVSAHREGDQRFCWNCSRLSLWRKVFQEIFLREHFRISLYIPQKHALSLLECIIEPLPCIIWPHKEWFNLVTEYIQKHITEPEIPVESIASELRISRSSFQRKIKGLTGLSPVEFIRHIRLAKAAELLSTGKYRVNEVAYTVGINKPSHFSSLFKKQYGVLPKDYMDPAQ